MSQFAVFCLSFVVLCLLYPVFASSPYCSKQDACPAGPISTSDSNLGSVVLKGMSEAIIDNTDCPGAAGVQDFTAMHADVAVGSTYTLSYNITTCGSEYNRVG